MMHKTPRPSVTDSVPTPPLFVRWALALLLREEERSAALNELGELYERRRAREGGRAAVAWYRRQVRQYPVRLALDRLRAGVRKWRSLRSDRRTSGRWGEAIHQTLQDLRHSSRSLSKTPGVSCTVVLTVGLGIGATGAVFSVVHAMLLKPLPYPEPGRLLRIYTDSPPNRWPLSVVDYRAIEEQQTSFESVAAYRNSIVTFNKDEVAERIWVRFVTPGYFPLLGITPLYGRTFVSADAVLEAEPTVVLAHGFWRERLGSDPDAVGSTIKLDGNEYRVVGVLPPDAGPLERQREVFPILQMEPPERKGPFFLNVLGRLKSGIEPEVARKELSAINERIFPLWKSSYSDATARYGVQSLHEAVIGNMGSRLLILLGAVGFVLLIASTNATNLLVARGTRRRRELAMRAALGASRGRLLQHLLSESALLALGGATLGLALTWGAIDALAATGPSFLPRVAEISLSGPVLCFTLAVTLGSGLLFGLIPSLQVTRPNLEHTLQASARITTPTERVRRILVSTQFAVAVPLLIGAGLLLMSFVRLGRVDPGIDQHNLLTMRITLPRADYTEDAAVTGFWDELSERVGALPGVTAVAHGTGRPPREVYELNNFNLEDEPTPPDQAEPVVPWPVVSTEYFRTLDIPLLRGRSFDGRDRNEAPPVAVVDRAWVKRFSRDKDPIGRRFHSGGCNGPECPLTTVIGVVGDVKYLGLDIPAQGTIYQPQRQYTWWARVLFVRTVGDPRPLIPAIRAVARELDPALPLSDVATMDELMQEALDSPRNFLGLISAFAAVALLLAAIGIYGVMSHFVQQHTRDIGIRMALGGSRAAVSRLVVGQGIRLALLGTTIGVGAALALTRFLSSILFEVAPTDAVTFVSATVVLVATGLLACAVPARRAAAVDPAVTLREE